MGNSGSTSAKRQAARHAREERKREFEREQEHETRLALERDELLARIRALLDENNIFDPLTDDDRAALARQCRRCVALPGERVLQWRTKRERAVTAAGARCGRGGEGARARTRGTGAASR